MCIDIDACIFLYDYNIDLTGACNCEVYYTDYLMGAVSINLENSNNSYVAGFLLFRCSLWCVSVSINVRICWHSQRSTHNACTCWRISHYLWCADCRGLYKVSNLFIYTFLISALLVQFNIVSVATVCRECHCCPFYL